MFKCMLSIESRSMSDGDGARSVVCGSIAAAAREAEVVAADRERADVEAAAVLSARAVMES